MCFRRQLLRKMWPIQLVAFLLFIICSIFFSSLTLCNNFHTIGPTDLLHPSPAKHFKTFQVFVMYFPKCCSTIQTVAQNLGVLSAVSFIIHRTSLHRPILLQLILCLYFSHRCCLFPFGHVSSQSTFLSAPCFTVLTQGQRVKVKVKVTLEQATKAQRVSRGIAVLFI